MATFENDDPGASPAATAPPPPVHGHDLGVELLPLLDETPAEYLARLKALHKRVGALIDTVESRKPVLGPVPAKPPRAVADRREPGPSERRAAEESDRRAGLPDPRSVTYERRYGARDRRTAPVDRRGEIERRRSPSPTPWGGGLAMDVTTLTWALQILAWIAVVVVALVYGFGD